VVVADFSRHYRDRTSNSSLVVQNTGAVCLKHRICSDAVSQRVPKDSAAAVVGWQLGWTPTNVATQVEPHRVGMTFYSEITILLEGPRS
jgi:hypothetical protein